MRCNKQCEDCTYEDCVFDGDYAKSIRNHRYYISHIDKEKARTSEYAKNNRSRINKRKRETYDPIKRHEYYLKEKMKGAM